MATKKSYLLKFHKVEQIHIGDAPKKRARKKAVTPEPKKPAALFMRPKITDGPWTTYTTPSKRVRVETVAIHPRLGCPECVAVSSAYGEDAGAAMNPEEIQNNLKACAAVPDMFETLEKLYTEASPGGVLRGMLQETMTKAGYTFP